MGSSCADSVSPPTMVHARGTPCTFSIFDHYPEKSRTFGAATAQIVIVRIKALPLVQIPSAWNLFLTLFEVSAELGSERCPLRSGLLLALMVQQTFMDMLTPLPPLLETRISDGKAVLPQSLHGASYFSGVQDEHASRSSYGTNWGVLAKISTRESTNTVVLAARRRPPALSANMGFRLAYSGNERRVGKSHIGGSAGSASCER